MFKHCTRCNENKLVELFSPRSKTKLNSWCKSCINSYNKSHYKNSSQRKLAVLERSARQRVITQNYVRDYLISHPCNKCGESDPVVLEFHHINTETKDDDISNMKRGGCSIERLEREILKCEVLCANCHRRHTYRQFGWQCHNL